MMLVLLLISLFVWGGDFSWNEKLDKVFMDAFTRKKEKERKVQEMKINKVLEKIPIKEPPPPPPDVRILGVVCSRSGCYAFTSEGFVKEGDVFRWGERVLKITLEKIVTDRREIKW